MRLARREAETEIPAETGGTPAGPLRANEHWKALYARIREVTENLRR